MNINNYPELLKPNEVAKYLKISTTTLNRMLKRGDLECIRINSRGDKVFKKEDIIKFLEERQE